MQRKFDNQQLADIRSRLANGETCASIARDYQVASHTIGNIKNGWNYNFKLYEQGYDKRARVCKQDIAKMRSLHESGLPLKAIADLYGVSYSTVRYRLGLMSEQTIQANRDRSRAYQANVRRSDPDVARTKSADFQRRRRELFVQKCTS